jgi:probable addiction module antidote protein
MAIETIPWDSAAKLRSAEEIAAYIDAVLEDGDPALLSHALGIVACAKGKADLATQTGLGREGLDDFLSKDGNPSFSAVIKVLGSLGVKLHASVANDVNP